MDSLGDLLPFLVAAGYLALKFRRRPERDRTAPVATRAARPASAGTAGPTPFEQLLARLDQETTAAPPAAPSATRVPEARRAFARTEPPRLPVAQRPENALFAENRAAFARDQERAAQTSAFRSLEATSPETSRGDATRGFDPSQRFFDAQGFDANTRGFERGDAGVRPAAVVRPGHDPQAVAPAPRFGSPAAIREAFVLATILARRPQRRPRPAAHPADPKRDAGA